MEFPDWVLSTASWKSTHTVSSLCCIARHRRTTLDAAPTSERARLCCAVCVSLYACVRASGKSGFGVQLRTRIDEHRDARAPLRETVMGALAAEELLLAASLLPERRS